MERSRCAGLTLIASLAAAAVGAQTLPTFRSSVEYVEVDVVVTNQQGEFIRDLTKDDFQVTEDGKRQPVANFSLIDIPVEKYQRPLFASQPIESDVRTNEHPFDGRVYVMMIDDLHTDPLNVQRTKGAARQFIEQRLGANDLMAIVHTAGPDAASQEFTSSKRLLLAAVDKTMGRQLESATSVRNQNATLTAGSAQFGVAPNTGDTLDMERAMHAETTLGLVRDVATWFSGVRGRKKSILLVSEGIDYDVTNVMERSDQPGTRASMVASATREAVDAAMRANVSIYGIDPRGVYGMDDLAVQYAAGAGDPDLGQRGLQNERRLEADSLRVLSDETGGAAIVGRNDLVKAYDQIVADNSWYYVLAYTSSNDKRDGRFHKIDVRVNRPGLTTRARRGYLAPKGKAPAPLPVDAAGPSRDVHDALLSPLPISGLTMSVSLAAFKGTAPNASVLLTADVRGRDLNLVPDDSLEFSYVAVDVKGKVQGGSNDKIRMTALRPDTRSRIEQSGLRLFSRIELAPGRYQLRIAARDEGAASVGSVAYDLDVPDFRQLPFSMSGLVMTSLSTGSMVVVKPDAELKDVLPAPPIAERSFPPNDEVAIFVEVYDNEAGSAHTVDIGTTLTSDTGQIVFRTDEERLSTEIGAAHGGYGYSARVPLTGLPPGLYVLTVEAKSRLGRQAVASRQVQISVSAPTK